MDDRVELKDALFTVPVHNLPNLFCVCLNGCRSSTNLLVCQTDILMLREFLLKFWNQFFDILDKKIFCRSYLLMTPTY